MSALKQDIVTTSHLARPALIYLTSSQALNGFMHWAYETDTELRVVAQKLGWNSSDIVTAMEPDFGHNWDDGPIFRAFLPSIREGKFGAFITPDMDRWMYRSRTVHFTAQVLKSDTLLIDRTHVYTPMLFVARQFSRDQDYVIERLRGARLARHHKEITIKFDENHKPVVLKKTPIKRSKPQGRKCRK